MPRKRTVGNAPQPPQGFGADANPPYGDDSEPNTINSTTNVSNTTVVNKGESRIMAMTAEQIATLMAGTRRKGEYLDYLNEFLASGEAGVCANEQWISLKDKKATTISQGFKNAKDNKAAAPGSENVSVITNEEKVYLINLKTAGVEVEAEPAVA